MNMLRILIFGVVVLAQLAVPAAMIWQREQTLNQGRVWKFRTAPVDPVDVIRGRYIALRFAAEEFAWPKTLPNAGRTVYVRLKEDDAGFAVSNAPPFAGPLDVAQGRVKDRDALESRAKPGTALAADPKRQGNFGDKNDGRFPASESFLHCAEIHFGFTAAGDAMKQMDAKNAQLESRADLRESVFLFGVQFVRGGRIARVERIFGGIERLFPAFEQAVAQHAVDQGSPGVRKTQKPRQRKRAALGLEQHADFVFFVG